eukprot:1450512-Pyramimonas_sp.AAC.1
MLQKREIGIARACCLQRFDQLIASFGVAIHEVRCPLSALPVRFVYVCVRVYRDSRAPPRSSPPAGRGAFGP